MPPGILDRLIWAAAIVGTGLLLFRLMNASLLRRATARARETSLIRPGRPAILYFTTPDCAACKAVQRPALNRLEARLGRRLMVVEVDAYEHPDLAERLGRHECAHHLHPRFPGPPAACQPRCDPG